MPSLRIGATFPASWYLMVAMPEAEGEVVEKDIIYEQQESDSEATGELGGVGRVGGERGCGEGGLGKGTGDKDLTVEGGLWK